MKMTKRGGARIGSGRKPNVIPSKKASFTIESELLNKLPKKGKSRFVNDAIKTKLDEEGR